MCVNNRQKASILKGFGFGGEVLSKPNLYRAKLNFIWELLELEREWK
jgi:hypothetical protein